MLIKALLIIAISVVLSTIINVIIMRKTTEIAVKEIVKVENRMHKTIELNRVDVGQVAKELNDHIKTKERTRGVM
ncbi:hypothetical protein [Oceanobacillus alkalisoli]|uniref:hypothetical protein n=1 Tax=Oceanobacillus alkalisoli TaxID=2925113 RepID=UPI001EE3B4F7|nr:hypothetical protein [Oceanobacillus alkalisoli]MCG5104455.1 hypothetical protein [Oceanobacillus alkalisoli]